MPKITKQLIDTATIPASGDAFLWDTELPGFGVRIQPSGRKTYMMRYRTKDGSRTQRKLTLCRCADAPPTEARNMAREVFMRVARGEDPTGERKPAKAKPGWPTLEALFQARVAAMQTRGRANAGEVERVLLLAKHNAADFFGRARHPATVTPADVVAFVSEHYKAGHRGAADKARGYLAATFAWAIKSANDYTVAQHQDWGLTMNPAAAVAKDHGAIQVRDRNLTADELRIFWRACTDGNAGFTYGTEVALKLIMACGQRVQETLRLDGADLDLDAKLWTMPAHKTKGRKHQHTIPLPDIIIPDLERLKSAHGDGPLFPAKHASSATGILNSLAIAHAVRRYVTAEGAEVAPFQPRDLRRTWKSRAHDAGVDRFTRDLIQQHAKSDTGSRHYDRSDYGPQMRTAMNKWSRWLEAVIAGRQPLTLVA